MAGVDEYREQRAAAIARGVQARQVLDNPLYTDFYDRKYAELFSAFLVADPTDTENLKLICLSGKLLQKQREEFERFVTLHDVLEHEEAEEGQHG